MNLIDENVERESEEKQKRITKLIIIAIIALVAIVVIILIYSAIKKKNTFTIAVDGNNKEFKTSMFMMTENEKNLYISERGQIYISVRELANMLGVEYFNDEFKGRGEDITKCYIKTDNEYTSYISGSSEIYKVIDNKAKNEEIANNNKNNRNNSSNNNNNTDIILANDYEYEYFNIDDGVRYENNEIYASQEAVELGFNVNISYDQKNKSVKIYTLDGLQKAATNTIGASVVIDNIDYYNKKLLKYGFSLIKNGNNDYGIANYINYQDGNYILSCKYSNIKFIESLSCLIVTTSDTNEQGILKIDLNGNENVKTLVDPRYEEINQLSEDGSLYVVKEYDKYGILKIVEDESDIKTETLLKCEYQTIGIEDYSVYDNMKSRYIINDKFIPIKRDDKWGVASKDGKIVIIPQYDMIGCNLGESGKPVLCIPDLRNRNDGLVFGKITTGENNTETRTYHLIDTETKSQIGYDALEVYSVYENNDKVYYMRIMAADQSIHRIDIYGSYAEPAKDSKSGSTGQNNNSQNTITQSN